MAHQAAVFRMASLEAVTVSNLWSDDVTVEAMPVVGGALEVPDRPGLGVTLDRAKLERYAHAPRPEYGRFLVRVRYAGGPTLYFRHDPDAGLHGAAGWTLRQWGQKEKLKAAEAALAKLKDWGERRWYADARKQVA